MLVKGAPAIVPDREFNMFSVFTVFLWYGMDKSYLFFSSESYIHMCPNFNDGHCS